MVSNVTQYLTSDNNRLAVLLAGIKAHAELGQPTNAQASCLELAAGWQRHVRLEEKFLFPVLEMRTGVSRGRLGGFRADHRRILDALRTMHEALAVGQLERFREGLAAYEHVLQPHEMTEKAVLYPMIDMLLTESERSALLDRMRLQ